MRENRTRSEKISNGEGIRIEYFLVCSTPLLVAPDSQIIVITNLRTMSGIAFFGT
jgi:hypothetical protein